MGHPSSSRGPPRRSFTTPTGTASSSSRTEAAEAEDAQWRVRALDLRTVHHRRSRATMPVPELIDLSHTVHDGLVTYPGLPAPMVSDHLSVRPRGVTTPRVWSSISVESRWSPTPAPTSTPPSTATHRALTLPSC